MLKKILILAPYPLSQAPSQRFRFELFLKSIEEKGWKYDFQSFLSMRGWHSLYKQGHVLEKIISIAGGFLRRFKLLFRLSRYDAILIHRELTPFGPPIFEWMIAKVFRKKIIYDFDDAIWLSDLEIENPIWKWLKWRSKVASICSWSWKVSTGNHYLADYAKRYCKDVVVLPTVVDTTIHKPLSKVKSQKPIIGWTGSHSTLFYLDEIVPILQHLEKKHEFEFLVIANRNPNLALKNYRFLQWSRESEIEDLSQIDIGVMPLKDTEWVKGKCGFKLIQYMALEIPALASPVGVNSQIIQEGVNGFLAHSKEHWIQKLSLLLEDASLRTKLGKAGRMTIENQYSVKANKIKFLSLFEA